MDAKGPGAFAGGLLIGLFVGATALGLVLLVAGGGVMALMNVDSVWPLFAAIGAVALAGLGYGIWHARRRFDLYAGALIGLPAGIAAVTGLVAYVASIWKN